MFGYSWIFEDGRYELIEGEITAKAVQNQPHLISVSLTSRALLQVFGEAFTVVQHSAYCLSPGNRPNPTSSFIPEDAAMTNRSRSVPKT